MICDENTAPTSKRCSLSGRRPRSGPGNLPAFSIGPPRSIPISTRWAKSCRQRPTLLTAARKKAGTKLTKAAVKHLLELGFTDPVLAVDVIDGDLGPWGRDEVRLLFASDSRLTPGEVGRVASGGELSRLVLSLRLAGTSGSGAQVLVFDEIDAGIGGATALAMGRKLAALSSRAPSSVRYPPPSGGSVCPDPLCDRAARGDGHREPGRGKCADRPASQNAGRPPRFSNEEGKPPPNSSLSPRSG